MEVKDENNFFVNEITFLNLYLTKHPIIFFLTI